MLPLLYITCGISSCFSKFPMFLCLIRFFWCGFGFPSPLRLLRHLRYCTVCDIYLYKADFNLDLFTTYLYLYGFYIDLCITSTLIIELLLHHPPALLSIFKHLPSGFIKLFSIFYKNLNWMSLVQIPWPLLKNFKACQPTLHLQIWKGDI